MLVTVVDTAQPLWLSALKWGFFRKSQVPAASEQRKIVRSLKSPCCEVLMETLDKIKQQIAENPILLFMKGSPKFPSCGFSAQASQALIACGEQFAYVDILQNPDIRAELPKYANWPTFPQLWVEGELIGGCDIVLEMFQRGELQPLIKQTAAKVNAEKTAE
jgi:monothiol glutaredoxin